MRRVCREEEEKEQRGGKRRRGWREGGREVEDWGDQVTEKVSSLYCY